MKEWFKRLRISLGVWIIGGLQARHVNLLAHKVYSQKDAAKLARSFGLIVSGAAGPSYGDLQEVLHG